MLGAYTVICHTLHWGTFVSKAGGTILSDLSTSFPATVKPSAAVRLINAPYPGKLQARWSVSPWVAVDTPAWLEAFCASHTGFPPLISQSESVNERPYQMSRGRPPVNMIVTGACRSRYECQRPAPTTWGMRVGRTALLMRASVNQLR